jgi:hypothetical protein
MPLFYLLARFKINIALRKHSTHPNILFGPMRETIMGSHHASLLVMGATPSLTAHLVIVILI